MQAIPIARASGSFPVSVFLYPSLLTKLIHRTLVTSILGQQISWLAARSITHRFIRLYDPSLPEKVADMPPGFDPGYEFLPSFLILSF